jgi:hypothetical protein
MFLDRMTAAIPDWLAMPLSFLSTLAALAGSGCLFAAAVFGAFGWAYTGLASFAVAALLWQVADRIASPA